MDLAEIALLGIALVLGAMVFRLAAANEWHWIAGVFLALIPIAFAYFLGIIGVLIAGLFVGAVYKAMG